MSNFTSLIKFLRKTAEQVPLFLALLPLFIVIHIEKQYHHFIVYPFVYKEILWLFAAPVVIFLLSRLLLKSWKKAGVFSFFLLMIFYFFCDLKDWLHQVVNGGLTSRYIFLLPVLLGLTITLYVAIKKVRRPFARLYLYINTTLLTFIIIDVIGVALDTSVYKNDPGDRSKPVLSAYTPCQSCIKPDMFYIIFDEYSSSNILQKEFSYHNTIDSLLASKKFRVIPLSTSNYNLTPFSVASCFNLNYLPRLNVEKDFYLKDYLPGLPGVYKSELIPILEREGYQIINHSIFNLQNHKPITPTFDLWELNLLYSRHNIFKKIDYDIGWLIRSRLSLNLISNTYRNNRNLHFMKSFQGLLKTIREPSASPKFVYAHFMLPHAPYCFDSSGRLMPRVKRTTEADDKRDYVNQVAYTNNIIINIVNEIFSNQKRPFIIIIQGDHGYKYHDQSKAQLEFGNLNAMYFYNQDYRFITDSTSNVNTFRIVLNTFFKKNFKMLKDTSYFLHYK